MIKKLLKVSLCFCFVVYSGMPLLALEDVDSQKMTLYDLPELSYENIEQQIDEFILNHSKNDLFNIKSFSNDVLLSDYQESTTLVGSQLNRWVNLGFAKNQYPNGVTFTSGGSIYWVDGGSGTDINVSFTINYQVASVGISVGRVPTGVTAYLVNCVPNRRCKLEVSKKVNFYLYYVVKYQGAGVWWRGYVPVKHEVELLLKAIYV